MLEHVVKNYEVIAPVRDSGVTGAISSERVEIGHGSGIFIAEIVGLDVST
ncbi:MAG: hypothetical protein ABSG34_06050 [Candidatus Sulfotelmatobacter sp.]|jgi:hypothetical protein